MSSYLNLFIRSKNDEFIPIGSYSRSSTIYSIMENRVPYTKICAFDEDMLMDLVSDCEASIREYEKYIDEQYDRVEFIKLSNGSLKDKIEEYEYCVQEIDELKETLEEYRCVKGQIQYLFGILFDNKYDNEGYDATRLIYGGIEIGYPCVDDIE